jgi:hypothetical protein
MLVHTYYCHSHLGIKQYLKFKFILKLPLNSVNTTDLNQNLTHTLILTELVCYTLMTAKRGLSASLPSNAPRLVLKSELVRQTSQLWQPPDLVRWSDRSGAIGQWASISAES